MKNRSLYLDEGCGFSFPFLLISYFYVCFCLRKQRNVSEKGYNLLLNFR